MEGSADKDFDRIILPKIQRLRERLLDLSLRNSLISMKIFSSRGSLVRVVDELPDVLYERIRGKDEKEMRFDPLPPLLREPEDEKNNEKFLEAHIYAQQTDEKYIQEMDSLNPDDDDYLDQLYEVERKLKDKIRENAGMAPRPKDKEHASLKQHAENNNIRPDWELPTPEEVHDDGRHEDDAIQTLLLPEDMEKKLKDLIAKNRSWQLEKGFKILFAAFGLLEWSPKGPKGKEKKVYSPLVLLPVDIKEEGKRVGKITFKVTGRDERGEKNLVLEEKLKIDEGITLPEFNGESVEEYFKEVEKVLREEDFNFRILRQVAFGDFSSSLMSIYKDLDPKGKRIRESSIIQALFAGSESVNEETSEDDSFTAYSETEEAVPFLVMDADSSQFHAVVEVMNGKNLALEGPPGTGKSQTIVNIIANAIVEGKKVLFVAEKRAALEVVRSRLETLGLAEFVLPLQTQDAKKSEKKEIILSVKRRLDMKDQLSGLPTAEMRESDWARSKELREHLLTYIEIISSKFGATGMTVHEILGTSIKLKTEEALELGPKGLQAGFIEGVEQWNKEKIKSMRDSAESIISADVRKKAALPHWEGTTLQGVDTFLADKIQQQVENTAQAYENLINCINDIGKYKIDSQDSVFCEILSALFAEAGTVIGSSQDTEEKNLQLLISLCQSSHSDLAKEFFRKAEDLLEREKKLAGTLSEIRSGMKASFIPKVLRKTALHKNLELVPDKPVKVLKDAAKIISQSNALALLSPQYHLARLVAKPLLEEGFSVKQDYVKALHALADEIESLYREEGELNTDEALKNILGEEFFKGRQSDFKKLKPFLALAVKIKALGEKNDLVLTILQDGVLMQARESLKNLDEAKISVRSRLENLTEQSGVNFSTRLARKSPKDAIKELRAAAADTDGLKAHARYAEARREFTQANLTWILDAFEAENLSFESLPDLLEKLVYQSMVSRVYEEYREVLSAFEYSGEKLNKKRKEFANADKDIIGKAPAHVRRILLKNSDPPEGVSRGKASEKTELSFLNREIEKKRAFRPTRELVSRSGAALQDLKPCWMMSPPAVAQYLSQDIEFDLCIIDEASQMLPGYAIGALMRSKQAVICGDVNQLPPSTFFRAGGTENEEDEDTVVLEESILELANTNFHPKQRLCWHYRSLYSSLIAFCNRTMYDDDLVVFPSPEEVEDTPSDEEQSHTESKSREVSLVSLFPAGATYRKGTNLMEAQEMVKHILEFMKDFPDLVARCRGYEFRTT